MADLADVRRLARELPGVSEGSGERGQVGFSVASRGGAKGFAWTWLERVEPRQPRVARPDVLAAVLVRLPEIDVDRLAELLREAWRIQAPRELAAGGDGDGDGAA